MKSILSIAVLTVFAFAICPASEAKTHKKHTKPVVAATKTQPQPRSGPVGGTNTLCKMKGTC
jgi:hypothetical protein